MEGFSAQSLYPPVRFLFISLIILTYKLGERKSFSDLRGTSQVHLHMTSGLDGLIRRFTTRRGLREVVPYSLSLEGNGSVCPSHYWDREV